VKTTAAFGVLLLLVIMTGCAGMVFSHKPYKINAGTVVKSSPRTVLTQWPKGRWYYASADGSIAFGDRVDYLCPETVPALHTQFHEAQLTWDKTRKCWMWYSR